MAGVSLVKFAHRYQQSQGKRLFWQRADVDGAPFRGEAVPLYTEEEYEDKMVRVKDPHNGFFNITVPEENTKYLAILDGICNGWFQLIFIERFKRENEHYVEWVQYYLEDGSPTPYRGNSVVEMGHG